LHTETPLEWFKRVTDFIKLLSINIYLDANLVLIYYQLYNYIRMAQNS